MKILATFANRDYDPDIVELVDAWDEYSVDNNPEGFKESRDKALASLGTDLLRWTTVEIDIDTTAIEEALNPNIRIPGDVWVADADGEVGA